MIWLGAKRGYLTDWFTQRWVQYTGRSIALAENPWLAGLAASTSGIGPDYFTSLAKSQGAELHRSGAPSGILPDFNALHGPSFQAALVHPGVQDFYEQTSDYELDAWAHWCGFFRPFGWLLAVIFSRRLQQLNVPLSGLDTSAGISSEVLQFRDPVTKVPQQIAWFRRLKGNGNVLYAGFYSVCKLPGREDPCVKVVFPLPNGNAIVIMHTKAGPDGSFLLTSGGRRFGDPGFYFTVQKAPGWVWARYVRSLKETIHVFPGENELIRADHVLTYFGATFLRLHYRMRRAGFSSPSSSAVEMLSGKTTGEPGT
jgi:hypothetical protein